MENLQSRAPEQQLALSVFITTLNEAANITECIASVAALAAEIIVLDSGSRDDTCELARRAGAVVHVSADWPGFGAQKNRALALARQPWVLSLDADERVPPALQQEIRSVLSDAQSPLAPGAASAGLSRSPFDAFEIPRSSQFFGHWIHHCGWYPDYVLRLFRREAGRFSDDLVHERVLIQGRTGRLKASLQHYSYTSPAQVREKSYRYALAGARQLHARGRHCGVATPALRAAWAWLRTWLLRRGFLDGGAGLSIAAMNARTTYLKYAMLRRLHRGESIDDTLAAKA